MYRLLGATAMVATILSAPITIAAENPDIATLHRELQSLKQEYETRMRALEQRLEAAEQAAQVAQSKARAATQKAAAAGSRPPSAQTALDTALAEAEGPTEAASPATTASAPSRDIWSRRGGAADLRLIQLSLDTLVAGGRLERRADPERAGASGPHRNQPGTGLRGGPGPPLDRRPGDNTQGTHLHGTYRMIEDIVLSWPLFQDTYLSGWMIAALRRHSHPFYLGPGSPLRPSVEAGATGNILR